MGHTSSLDELATAYLSSIDRGTPKQTSGYTRTTTTRLKAVMSSIDYA